MSIATYTNGTAHHAEEPAAKAVPLAHKAVRSDTKLKVMAWGEPGSGKSRLALSFPKPLVADLERSTGFYADEFDFWVSEPTPSLPGHAMVGELVKQVAAGMYPDRQTLVIDPVTDYLDQLEAGLINQLFTAKHVDVNSLRGMAKATAYSQLNDGIRKRLNAILALKMHIVFVVRAKHVWGDTDKGMAPVGRTYDCKEILESLCDVVLHVQKGGTAAVAKSRLKALPDVIRAASYADIQQALEQGAESPAPVVQAARPATLPSPVVPATLPKQIAAAAPAPPVSTAPDPDDMSGWDI